MNRHNWLSPQHFCGLALYAVCLASACDASDDTGDTGNASGGFTTSPNQTGGAGTTTTVGSTTSSSTDMGSASSDGSATAGDATSSESMSAGDTGETGETSTGGDGEQCDAEDVCTAVLDSFAPCGGDVAGSWSIANVCMVWNALDPDPDCPANQVMLAARGGGGNVEFAEGMVSFTNYEIRQVGHSKHSLACLPPGFGCELMQEMNEQAWDEACCAMIDDDICECKVSSVVSAGDSTAPYTSDGSSLTVDGEELEYCVDGSTLKIRFDAGTEDEMVMVLMRSTSE